MRNYWNESQQGKTADGCESCKKPLDFMHDFHGLPWDKNGDYSITKISSYLHRVSIQSTSDRPTGNACPSPNPGSKQRKKKNLKLHR